MVLFIKGQEGRLSHEINQCRNKLVDFVMCRLKWQSINMAVTNKIIQSIKNDQYKLPNINLRITENRAQKNEGFRIFR